MQCLDEVYEKIAENDIEVIPYSIPKNDAVTIEYMNSYGIFADYAKFDNSESEFMAISHEYGHCKSGATHKLYSPHQLIAQHENRANRAAVYELLPCEKIIEAVKGGNSEIWELAKYLEMPEQFVRMALEIYLADGSLNAYTGGE